MREKIKSTAEKNKAIGIFDSGFGGLTVMSSLHKKLPYEKLIYFGDTAHVPYGSKSKKAVIKFSADIASFLMKKNIKMLVIACNTASAFALPALKKTFDVPVAGVIEPGAKAAVEATVKNRIGIIGTEGTINSGSYLKAVKKISSSSVYQQSCPLLVPLVEEGLTEGEIADAIVRRYLKPLTAKNIDTLVLGCTHYPLLRELLQKNAGGKIKLIDSADATADAVKDILAGADLLADKSGGKRFSFYVSDNPEKFQKIGSRFFSKKIKNVKRINLE